MKCMYCGKEIEGFGNNPEDYGLHTPYLDFKGKSTCNDCDKLVTITNRILKKVLDSDSKYDLRDNLYVLENHIKEIRKQYK